jgi:hypothetical protein
VNAANAGALARTLANELDHAFLFRTLATLQTGIELFEGVDELEWRGPRPGFEELGARFDAATLGTRRGGESSHRAAKL